MGTNTHLCLWAKYSPEYVQEIYVHVFTPSLSRDVRLGRNGADEVKRHRFFKTNVWSWDTIRKSDAPVVPVLNSDIDTRYFDVIDEGEKPEPFEIPRVRKGKKGGREGQKEERT